MLTPNGKARVTLRMLWHLQACSGNSNYACHLQKHIKNAICVYEKLLDGKTLNERPTFWQIHISRCVARGIGGIGHPIIWFDVHCPKEQFTENCHSRVIVKWKNTWWWQAKDPHLQWLKRFENHIYHKVLILSHHCMTAPQRSLHTENLSLS